MGNRIIKFKGKRTDIDEWVEGDLVHVPLGCRIERWVDDVLLVDDVDPTTVCQYTGLKDKDGKEIYEGDYLSSVYNHPKQKKVEFKNGAFGINTYYRGLDFLPLACCDIRAGNLLIEFELIDRKEGEK